MVESLEMDSLHDDSKLVNDDVKNSTVELEGGGARTFEVVTVVALIDLGIWHLVDRNSAHLLAVQALDCANQLAGISGGLLVSFHALVQLLAINLYGGTIKLQLRKLIDGLLNLLR